jgi:hypothetical protein
MNIHNEDIAQVSVPDVSITEPSPAVLKQCPKCKEYKTLDLFHNDKFKKDGKHRYCKSCNTARSRAYREANPEKVKAYQRAYDKANKEKYMLREAKGRATQSNLAFNISIEDIHVPTHCPILGIALERGNGVENHDSSPSLDRIYPDKGYVKGNVQVISNLANRIKTNATFAQLVMMGEWAKQQEAA